MKRKKEYCCTNGHISYAGVHLIIEVWNAKNLTSLPKIKEILSKSIKACKVTLLNIELHKFSPSGGISGVAIIKESHLSIHTWPEYGYAALDIFLCGEVDPYKSIPVIREGFKTDRLQITEVKRGIF